MASESGSALVREVRDSLAAAADPERAAAMRASMKSALPYRGVTAPQCRVLFGAAIAARTDPGWVRSFVAAHDDRISALSRREALKHVGAG